MNQDEANQVIGDAIEKVWLGEMEGMRATSRLGVTFTPEQRAQIEALVEAGDTAAAQKIILDTLEVSLANS